MAKPSKAAGQSAVPSVPHISPVQAVAGPKAFHTIRYTNVKATIWRNQNGGKEPLHTVTVCRNFRDEAGEWHDSTPLHLKDLPHLAKAVKDAHAWIAWQERLLTDAKSK